MQTLVLLHESLAHPGRGRLTSIPISKEQRSGLLLKAAHPSKRAQETFGCFQIRGRPAECCAGSCDPRYCDPRCSTSKNSGPDLPLRQQNGGFQTITYLY
ncbi:g7700 [Coccomyxa viridis]|uniref:G7700 protein n=1 Tax=Coccomyxa viridis TaxID=1274662 RepID=A0ABP1G0Z2_9CHLO